MQNKVAVQLNDETVAKLDKLSAQLGAKRDELINKNLLEMLNEIEPTDS